MEMKHTPGPWVAAPSVEPNWLAVWSTGATDRFLLAKVAHYGGPQVDDTPLVDADANVRLIAAAPELAKETYGLAMLALQSERYTEDADYSEAVDNVLAILRRIKGKDGK